MAQVRIRAAKEAVGETTAEPAWHRDLRSQAAARVPQGGHPEHGMRHAPDFALPAELSHSAPLC
eukprot:4940260-Amphidinium_carterae.5